MNSQPFGPWLAAAIFLALATFSVSLIPYFFPTVFTTFLEKWRSLNSLKKLALIGILIGVTAFAGTKPSSGDDDTSGGSSTNDVTIVEGDSTNDVVIIDGDCTNDVTVIEGDSTNDVSFIEGDPTNSVPDDASSPTNQPPPVLMASRPRLVLSAPPQTQTENEPSAIHNSSFILQNSWNTRGAYCDWVHITFPDGFAFPSGTNLLTGVTLMAYGELRENLHCSPSTSLFALPNRVSLVPGESSCAYGLTPSNTFLFAWQNVCVNRSSTNRVDASIELFRNGACSVRFDTVETFYPALPPPGFVGQGQDAAWVAAAFSPTDYAAITNKGYDAWLMEDYVGINEQNGRYKVDVTVSQLPQNGPCYLVVGPHRMTVTSPGTYSFPLEVDTDYLARTYPVAVPLSFSYDDGYRYEFDEPYPRLYGAPRLLGAPRNDDNIYHINQSARAVAYPSTIYLGEPFDGSVFIWCNKAGATRDFWSSVGDSVRVAFVGMTEAEIDEIVGPTRITFYWEDPKGHSEADVDIYRSLEIMHDYDEDDTNDTITVEGTNGLTSASRALIDSFATRGAQGGHKVFEIGRGRIHRRTLRGRSHRRESPHHRAEALRETCARPCRAADQLPVHDRHRTRAAHQLRLTEI